MSTATEISSKTNYNPLISIIVPIYGVEDYLDQCVESIVGQTYRNLEIILVDDGNKDKCPEMVDAWAKKDSRIIPIHKPNGGLSSARNAGMKSAKGEYTVFLDSDDWLEINAVQALLEAAVRYDSDVIVGGFQRVSSKVKKPEDYFIGTENDIYKCTVIEGSEYIFKKFIAVWGKMYKTSAITNLRFIEGRLAEDIPFQVDTLKKINSITFTNKVLYNYRIRDNSLARTISVKYLTDYILSVKEAYEASVTFFGNSTEHLKAWLAELLYELMASSSNVNQLSKSQSMIILSATQHFGESSLIDNVKEPLGVIVYSYSLFHKQLTREEKIKLQFDYRQMYLKTSRGQYGLIKFKKIIPFISLELARVMSKAVKRVL